MHFERIFVCAFPLHFHYTSVVLPLWGLNGDFIEISHLGVNWSLTWYKVPGTRYLVPGTWYLVPYLVPATWYSVPGRVLGMMETLAGDVNLEGFLGSALKVFLT